MIYKRLGEKPLEETCYQARANALWMASSENAETSLLHYTLFCY